MFWNISKEKKYLSPLSKLILIPKRILPFCNLLGRNIGSSLVVSIYIPAKKCSPLIVSEYSCTGSLSVCLLFGYLMSCGFVPSMRFHVFLLHLDFKLLLLVVLDNVDMYRGGDPSRYTVNKSCIENIYFLLHPVLSWKKRDTKKYKHLFQTFKPGSTTV